MKKVIISLFCLSLFIVKAQTVTVNKQQERVKGENTEGYATELDASLAEVSVAWSKYLKELGKVKNNGEVMTIAEPVVGGTPYAKGIIYATATGSDKKGKVWIGLKENEWAVNDIHVVYKDLEAFVNRFGVKFYKDKIQVQIDEAQQAADAVTRQQQRLVNQDKDLAFKLAANEKEKIRLEKLLEANKLEHAALLIKIDMNKKSQDSVANAGGQIKKVGELHKERQRKVN
ncbi:MAG: hypothetical protein DI538_06335 [Azospira oryzae]|nr:MAG: hypothetical protein DI538_06335 [Azospira oryzae]